MGFRYMIGRAGQEKTHRVLTEIREKMSQNKKNTLILLVPEQFTLQAERDLIEKLRLPGIIGVEVLSFTRLAHHVFNEVGGLTKVHINELGKNMILRKIVDDLDKELTIYRKAARQAGFIDMMTKFLSELKQYDVLPEDINRKLEELKEEPILQRKLQDIASIYERFNNYVQGDYIDSEDYINLLIDKISDSNYLKDAEIWIDGFHTLSPQMYRIIEKLGLVAKNMTFTFTMDIEQKAEDGDLFKISALHLTKICDIASKNNHIEEIIDMNHIGQGESHKRPEIKHIEQAFYAYPYQLYTEKAEHITLFAGLNLQTEVEHVAAKIISLVRDQGYRWKDIAVVTNNTEDYAPLIKRVFEEYDIPFFLDQKRRIMHNPIIELILSSLEVIEKGYPYQPIFRLFKTGFSGIDINQYEKLENYVLRYGIKGKKWREAFPYGDREEQEVLNTVRESFMNIMERLEKAMKGKKTVAEKTKALYEFLHSIKLDEQLEQWINRLREQEKYEYVNEYTQVWNLVMEMFDQLIEMVGEQQMSTREYIRVLESGFLSVEIGIIPSTIDQVLVGNMQRSKSHDIKALFFVGVNDGVVPSNKNNEEILADEERIYMKKQGLSLGTDSEKKAYEEKFMIYSVLSKPSEYLWISYSLADIEGKAIRPSILMDRFKRIFHGLEIESDMKEAAEKERQFISTPKSTFKHLVEHLRLFAAHKPIEPIWWEVYKWYQEHGAWEAKRSVIIDGLFHRNQVKDLDGGTAKKVYKTPIRASVSRLEQFVNCPFSHFVKYGLRPKERKMYKVEAPDVGEIFHNSLELFTKKLMEHNIIWRELDKKQTDMLIDQVVDEVIPNHGNEIMLSNNRYKYLVQRLKRISRRAAWTLTEHIKRSGFEPIGYEVGFGLEQPFPPIEIALPDGDKVYLEGRIDRVDIYDDDESAYIKVIDYKSGHKEFSLSEVYQGVQLQLMLYLEAILVNREQLNKKKLKPAGIFYFKIDDPMVQTNEKIVDHIEKEIRRKLKMKGLVLKDVNIVREIDREIDGYSEIIPVGLKKSDEFYDKSSVLDYEEYMAILDHVRKLVKEISFEIIKGNIRIQPSKNGKQVACQYCSYQAICQFDQRFQDNTYQSIKNMSDKEVIASLMGEEEKVSGDVDGRSTESD